MQKNIHKELFSTKKKIIVLLLGSILAVTVSQAAPAPGQFFYGNGAPPQAALFSEGGSFAPAPWALANSVEAQQPSEQELIYNELLAEEEQQRLAEAEAKRQRLAHEVYNALQLRKELEAAEAQEREQEQLYNSAGQDDFFVQATEKQQEKEDELNPEEVEEEVEENLEKFGSQLAEAVVKSQQSQETSPEVEKPKVKSSKNKAVENKANKEQAPEVVVEPKTPSKKPTKKGQYEFVEFVEPRPSDKLRGIEAMEKRGPSELEGGEGRHFNLFVNSGNLVFMAMIAMGCMMSAMIVAGGTFYYNRVRAARDDPFDEFMRYSPTGPGRDKMKKTHLPPCRLSPTGDETLAYKAQLHQYRQAKQKIIGGPVQPEHSDDEDEHDEPNNFSIYECPGLASTGDIEVQNPNFVGGGAKSPSPVPSQGSGRGE